MSETSTFLGYLLLERVRWDQPSPMSASKTGLTTRSCWLEWNPTEKMEEGCRRGAARAATSFVLLQIRHCCRIARELRCKNIMKTVFN